MPEYPDTLIWVAGVKPALDFIQGKIKKTGIIDNQTKINFSLLMTPTDDRLISWNSLPNGGAKASQGNELFASVNEKRSSAPGKDV